MVNWFFWLAMIVTALFFVLVLVLFVCQWIIYYRVERTWLHYDEQIYSKGKGDEK
ncbi:MULTISPECIES: hypothetical protein [Limosilactobacillus]|uniref:hypothetical protein n=1 Tax=Limosilactobacillus TaxID=2742598 RepID=UPI0013C2B30F|nr:hypothetical protein [Limosilactobacillus reuteri]